MQVLASPQPQSKTSADRMKVKDAPPRLRVLMDMEVTCRVKIGMEKIRKWLLTFTQPSVRRVLDPRSARTLPLYLSTRAVLAPLTLTHIVGHLVYSMCNRQSALTRCVHTSLPLSLHSPLPPPRLALRSLQPAPLRQASGPPHQPLCRHPWAR